MQPNNKMYRELILTLQSLITLNQRMKLYQNDVVPKSAQSSNKKADVKTNSLSIDKKELNSNEKKDDNTR
jgi:hypothetical protein